MKERKSVFWALLALLAFSIEAKSQFVVRPLDCYGDSTTVSVILQGWGKLPFHYLWSRNDTTATITRVKAGNYWVKITDKNGKDTTLSVKVDAPAKITVVPTLIKPSTCDGFNDGAISISVSGGVRPYSFRWTNHSTDSAYYSKDLSGIRGGKHTVEVTDSLGCRIVSDTVNVLNQRFVPTTLVADTYVCNGLKGSVNIRADLAAPGIYYRYSSNATYNTWTSTSNDSVFDAGDNYLAGKYTLYVTALTVNPGCMAYVDFTIRQSQTPMVVSSDVRHNACYEDRNGRIELTVTGGDPLPDYHYLWVAGAGSGSTSASRNSLAPGSYRVVVTDDGACRDEISFKILPEQPLSGRVAIVPATCNGFKDGSLQAYVTGGQGPYRYDWNTGSHRDSIAGLAAGPYSLTVRDTLGCRRDYPAIVGEPLPLSYALDSLRDVRCFGGNDGALWGRVAGGNDSLRCSWTKDGLLFKQSSPSLSGISSGTYALILRDRKGCRLDTSIAVSQPTETLFSDSTHIVSCNNGRDAYWELKWQGAYAPYKAYFSTKDSVSSDTARLAISSLGAGDYSAIVIDRRGCRSSFVKSFAQPLPISIGPEAIIDASCHGGSNGSIRLAEVHGGTAPYRFIWSNGDNSFQADSLAAGSYQVTVYDSYDCPIIREYKVSQPFNPLKFFPEAKSASCRQAEDGMAKVDAWQIYDSPYRNGFKLFNMAGVLIDSVAPGQWVSGLAPGNYRVQVVSELGCSASDTVSIAAEPYDCIDIPNAITPNGDGVNDAFRVLGADKYDSFEVTVFNSSGVELFYSKDPEFSWDAYYKGSKLPSNTSCYYRIVTTEKGKKSVYQAGFVIKY